MQGGRTEERGKGLRKDKIYGRDSKGTGVLSLNATSNAMRGSSINGCVCVRSRVSRVSIGKNKPPGEFN